MGSIKEQKNGTIDSFYDADSGIIKESTTDSRFEFFHEGAQVSFVQGEQVSFLKVTTPTGKIIVQEIQKPT